MTEAVKRAIRAALGDHELIKVSLGGASSKERKALAAIIAEQTGSHVVQTIGKVGAFYRRKKTDPVVPLLGVKT